MWESETEASATIVGSALVAPLHSLLLWTLGRGGMKIFSPLFLMFGIMCSSYKFLSRPAISTWSRSRRAPQRIFQVVQTKRLFCSNTSVDPIATEKLSQLITAKGDEIRAMKEAKADKDQIKASVAELIVLKAQFEAATGGTKEEAKKQPIAEKTLSPKELRMLAKEEAKKSSSSSSSSSISGGAGGKKEKEVAPALGLSEIRQVRIDKLESIKADGKQPFAYEFTQSHKSDELKTLCKDLANGEENSSLVASMAGRVMVKRSFGKLAFFTLQDDKGQIQLYLDKGRLADEFDKLIELVDAGDIVGVTGTAKRTDKGELSIYVQSWTMLTKSLLPLPDKYHGLTDTNKRYRQRHLDMITNPNVRNVFRSRAFIISAIRRMLDELDYVEVETPVLNNQPGGAEAKPFLTYHNSLAMDLTLRIATELHLKRLIVGGFDRVYEIGRIFRNEGLSTRHNPEFTSIELYHAYVDYNYMMSLTERMISSIAEQLHGSYIVDYQGAKVDFTPPWRRVSMSDIVKVGGV